jgi:uncharacterized damage-inducible protein DinB
MEKTKWFDRNLNFSTVQNIFPTIIERLRGTPARLEEKFVIIPAEMAMLKIDHTWSIKENIGHLIDLEPLWRGRLEDILSGQIELRQTGLKNKQTDLANYNARSLDGLLSSFRQLRGQTVSMLEKIDERIIFRSALHPRLKTPMRTMDLFLFVAEHDDHHLARIAELINLFSSK